MGAISLGACKAPRAVPPRIDYKVGTSTRKRTGLQKDPCPAGPLRDTPKILQNYEQQHQTLLFLDARPEHTAKLLEQSSRDEFLRIPRAPDANIGQHLANLGRMWPNLDQTWPTLGQLAPILIKLGQCFAELGGRHAKVGSAAQNGPRQYQLCPIRSRKRPFSIEFLLTQGHVKHRVLADRGPAVVVDGHAHRWPTPPT